MNRCVAVTLLIICCVATGCLTYTVHKPLATFGADTPQPVVLPLKLPGSKIGWWIQLQTGTEVKALPFPKSRVKIRLTNLSARPVQIFFLQRPGFVLGSLQSSNVFDGMWETYPQWERLFACDGGAELRLDITFDPEVRLVHNIQVVAVKSDAL